MAKQAKTSEATIKEASNPDDGNKVELEWGEVEMLFNARDHLIQMEEHLGTMCVRFEKNKQELVSRINQVEEMLYKLADELKEKKDINPDIECSLQLPDTPEKKGYFLLTTQK